MEGLTYEANSEPKVVDASPLYTEQPKKKSNAWWIILLVVLLVLCCCIAIGAMVVFFLVSSGQYRIDWSLLTPILSLI